MTFPQTKTKEPNKATMSNFADPSWAQTGGAPAGPAPEPTIITQPSPTTTTARNGVRPTDQNRCVQWCLSILCMSCAVGMASLGVLGVLDLEGSLALDNVSQLFVSIYLIIFATILFLYELMWWTNLDHINRHIRKNFGFLYHVVGKGTYLIFVAFLTIGLGDDVKIRGIRYIVGGAFLATGVLLVFLGCTNSEMLGAYNAPTGGFTSSSTEVRNPV